MRNLVASLFLSTLVLCAFPAAGDCIYPHWDAPQSLDREAVGIEAADLNGDQRPDLVGHGSSAIFVALNDGSGLFSGTTDVYTGTISGPLVTGDFTGDGKTDVAFGTNGALSVLPGFGDGTFGTAITTWDASTSRSPHATATPTSFVRTATAAATSA